MSKLEVLTLLLMLMY